MWTVSDDTLLAGLGARDADAAAAFVERFQRRVFGLAFTIVGDRGVAEDVAQEAFVRAWKHASAYDTRRGTVAAWLLAITRNLAIDAVRVRRPTAVDPDDLLALRLSSAGPTPEEAAVTSDDIARVREVLTTLPEEQRRALLLAALHGHTAREISEAEAIPLGTAKTRIRSALLRLRAVLVSEERAE